MTKINYSNNNKTVLSSKCVSYICSLVSVSKGVEHVLQRVGSHSLKFKFKFTFSMEGDNKQANEQNHTQLKPVLSAMMETNRMQYI